MTREQINRVSSRILILLALIALAAVVSGYNQPPQPDEATAARIFQLAVVAFAGMLLLFLVTADWEKRWQSARPLRFPVSALLVAFAALYYMERYR